MANVLVTGASRGIGLEFAQQYLADGWRVFATCRAPEKAHDLKKLEGDGLSVMGLDVSSPDGIAALAQLMRNESLDLLLNNAGVAGRDAAEFGQLDPRDYAHTLCTNAIAPIMLTQALLPQLERGQGKMIAAISSQLGSVGRNQTGGRYAYRASKAALNAAMKSLSIDLEPRGITVLMLHPGWVKTDMGGSCADINAQTSVKAMRKVIASTKPSQSGHFLNYDGTEIPW